MEPPKRPPEYTLEIFADSACVKDILKGILHTIFFHRTFPAIRPINRDILDISLPAVDDVDLETLIDQRSTALVRQLDNAAQQQTPSSSSPYTNAAVSGSSSNGSSGRGQLAVQFFEKRRRKTYFFQKGDDEICWEQWTLSVTLARPKTESEASEVRKAMERSVQKAAMKVVNIASEEKDHIPPITSNEATPFPYQIIVNPKDHGWSRNIGIFS